MLRTFGELSDPRFVSEEVFLAYITHAARQGAIKAINSCIDPPGGARNDSPEMRMELEAVAALELCELSKRFARKASDCLNAQLAAAIAAAPIAAIDDCVTQFAGGASAAAPGLLERPGHCVRD